MVCKAKDEYHVFVYNGSEPKNVTRVFLIVDSVIGLFCSIVQLKVNLIVLERSMRLHFLDVYVNYQI